MNQSTAVLDTVEIQEKIETWVHLNFKMLIQWLRQSTALTLTWSPVWIAACPEITSILAVEAQVR